MELDNELDGEARCLWIGLVCALIDPFFEWLRWQTVNGILSVIDWLVILGC